MTQTPDSHITIDIETLPWPILLLQKEDEQFLLCAANQATLKKENIPPCHSKNLIGQPFNHALPKFTPIHLQPILEETIRTQQSRLLHANELPTHLPPSEWREIYLSPISSHQVLVICHDNSEIHQQFHEQQQNLIRLGQVIDNIQEEIYIFDPAKCHFNYINHAALSHLGYSENELMDCPPTAIMPLMNKSQFQALIHPLITKERPFLTFETTFQTKTKERYDAEVRLQLMPLDHSLQVVMIVTDITHKKAMRQQQNLLSQAIEQSEELVRITDTQGIIQYANQAFCEHSGYQCEELIGHKSNLLRSGLHDNTFYQNLWQTLLSGKTFKGTFINRKKDGSLFYESETITPILNERNETTHFVATGRDITEQVRLEERLTALATTDQLTQVANRHATYEQLETEFNRFHHHPETPFAVLSLDIDHFKNINDQFGHDIGDKVLQHFAQTLQNIIRKSDFIGRVGGEEFLIIAPNTQSENLPALTEKIRHTIASTHFPVVDQVTTSIGATLSQPEDSAETLLKRADIALYQAKNQGRNRSVIQP